MSSIKALPLYEGTYSVGTDKEFVPIDPGDSAEKGALKISITPFLIPSGERNYLLDTGLGEFGPDTSCDIIRQNLSNHGFTEYDITDIFLSHLHYDHMGGLAERCNGYWELTFPEARLWVAGKAWEKVIKEEFYDREKTEFLHFIDAKADLHYLEDTVESPYPDLTIRQIGGHTKHHLAFFYQNNGNKYLMAGDVIGAVSSVNRKFAAKYDYDPQQSMKARKELAKKAYEQQFVILAYHDPVHPLSRLTDFQERKGYTIEGADSKVKT